MKIKDIMNKNIKMNEQLTDTDYSDRRRTTALVLDVETTLSESNEQTVFDVGYTISEVTNEKMVIHRSFIVKEIFLNINLMKRAFYFKKYPLYVMALASGRTQLKSFHEIVDIMQKDIQRFNVRTMYAYNAGFDKDCMEYTHKYLYGDVIDINLKVECLWSLASQTFMNTEKFIKTAFEKEWLTEKGNVKTSAEIAYRYLFNDDNFIEQHTGLEDSIVETKILWKIKSYGKKQNGHDKKMPWLRIKNKKDSLGL